jgi:parallel beta-helix repeat protein
MKHFHIQWAQTFGLAVVVMIVLTGSALPASAATSIASCPFTITAPGNYVVTADLNCAGDAIDVQSSNVSVSLNGHIITGPGTVSDWGAVKFTGSIGVKVTGAGRLNHVIIEGPGLIRKFAEGVLFLNADYCQVNLVTASSNNAGIEGLTVTYLTLGSDVTGSNADYGVFLAGSINGAVTNNDASGNLMNGIYVGATTATPGSHIGPGLNSGSSISNTVINNTANGNDEGIVIEADGSRVIGNVTNGNRIGIRAGGMGNQIFSNKSSVANAVFDLSADETACIWSLWSDNIFFTRNQVCIH